MFDRHHGNQRWKCTQSSDVCSAGQVLPETSVHQGVPSEYLGVCGRNLGMTLASGQAQINYRIPNPRVWRTAAMKHAYLGACLALGEIPDTAHARQVRADLVAVRDSKKCEPFPGSRICRRSADRAVPPGRPGADDRASCPRR